MDAISINVSGRRYEISQQTFSRMSQAMGSRLQTTATNFLRGRKEYFFERHSDVFQTILYYYQTNDLHMPQGVCPVLYRKEMEFWGVQVTEMSKCCYNAFSVAAENHAKLLEFERYFKVRRRQRATDAGPAGRREQIRTFCWELMNDPFSSIGAEIYFWVSVVLVLLNITVICLSSHPDFYGRVLVADFPGWIQAYIFRHYGPLIYEAANLTNVTYAEFMLSDKVTVEFIQPYLFISQLAFCGCFSIEFLFLVIFCPSARSFFSSRLHLIDLLALLPFYVWLIMDATYPEGPYIYEAEQILQGLAILRVFRLLRLARRVKGLRILLFALKSSVEDILLLVLMLLLATVFFSSIIYYVDDRTSFPSIVHGFWWALVTMTTVGYGDQVPTTLWGKVIGSLCAISGVIIVALTVPVFVSKFQLYYSNKERREPDCPHDHSRSNVFGGKDTTKVAPM